MRVGNVSTSKESDIHVRFESIDICKCRISNARCRVAVMQHLLHIVSTCTHDPKPMLCDLAQFAGMFLHPDIDGWVSLNRTRESEELAHLVEDSGLTPELGRAANGVGLNEFLGAC